MLAVDPGSLSALRWEGSSVFVEPMYLLSSTKAAQSRGFALWLSSLSGRLLVASRAGLRTVLSFAF